MYLCLYFFGGAGGGPAKRTSEEVALAKRKGSKQKDTTKNQHLNKLMGQDELIFMN
jgi:hypothetical protein